MRLSVKISEKSASLAASVEVLKGRSIYQRIFFVQMICREIHPNHKGLQFKADIIFIII